MLWSNQSYLSKTVKTALCLKGGVKIHWLLHYPYLSHNFSKNHKIVEYGLPYAGIVTVAGGLAYVLCACAVCSDVSRITSFHTRSVYMHWHTSYSVFPCISLYSFSISIPFSLSLYLALFLTLTCLYFTLFFVRSHFTQNNILLHHRQVCYFILSSLHIAVKMW